MKQWLNDPHSVSLIELEANYKTAEAIRLAETSKANAIRSSFADFLQGKAEIQKAKATEEVARVGYCAALDTEAEVDSWSCIWIISLAINCIKEYEELTGE